MLGRLESGWSGWWFERQGWTIGLCSMRTEDGHLLPTREVWIVFTGICHDCSLVGDITLGRLRSWVGPVCFGFLMLESWGLLGVRLFGPQVSRRGLAFSSVGFAPEEWPAYWRLSLGGPPAAMQSTPLAS